MHIKISWARRKPPKHALTSAPSPSSFLHRAFGSWAAIKALVLGNEAEMKYVPSSAVTINSRVSGPACAIRATPSTRRWDMKAGIS